MCPSCMELGQEMFERGLPSVEEVRERIDGVRPRVHRLALRFQYLTAGRRSEVCGKWWFPAENVSLEEWVGEEAVVFYVKTAKRKGKIRPVALPLNPDYEPWTQSLYDYMLKRKRGRAFPFSDKTLYRASVKAFDGLWYPIEDYKDIQRHWRPLATHGLRHVRAKELLEFYGFSAQELAVYCGWSLRSVMRGAVSVLERYVTLQWRDYFPKLLRRRVI